MRSVNDGRTYGNYFLVPTSDLVIYVSLSNRNKLRVLLAVLG